MTNPEGAAAECDMGGLAGRVHAGCVVCGDAERNPASLRIAFAARPDGSVAASCVADERHQGYAGLMHGGMIATLLDAAMTHCPFARGIAAMTAELSVRFVAPVKAGWRVDVTARLIESRRRTHRLEARLSRGGSLLARATAKFIDPGTLANPAGPSGDPGCASGSARA